MKEIFGVFTGIAGILGIIGSAIAMRLWLLVTVILVILKLTGVVSIAWFAGPFTAGAISTGLFMLFGGLFMMGLSLMVTAISAAILDN